MKRGTIREAFFQIELKKRRKVQNFLLKSGLTPGQGQARILRYLAEQGPANQKELADGSGLDVTTMSRTLDKMEQAGYLIRTRNPRCRRSCQVELTPGGREKAEEVGAGFDRLEEILVGGMTETEQKTLLDLLEKVEQNLNQDTEENS